MDVTAALHEALKDDSAVHLVVLFGSRAQSRARPDIDVDVGIRWSPGVGRPEQNAVLDQIERAVHATVDAVDLGDAPPLLRMEIARTGVVVVARSNDAWPDFKARAMLDWWDFAPYARIMYGAARARLKEAVDGAR